MPADAGLMVLTAAYTGLRWGELAGLQCTRAHLNDTPPRIDVHPDDGALHELGGRLELGPPKTAASARTVHLPPFLADRLTEHRDHTPTHRSCSPAPTAACTAAPTSANASATRPRRQPRTRPAPIHQGMHFHDLRHTHETWLVEAQVPRVLRLQRLGHKRKDIDDFYSHTTPAMREKMLTALQQRWERSPGQGVAQNLDPGPEVA